MIKYTSKATSINIMICKIGMIINNKVVVILSLFQNEVFNMSWDFIFASYQIFPYFCIRIELTHSGTYLK